ncbi:hypothetical protein AB0B42_00435 [Streptomyces fradiae]|uniref:hypothetical protein n=1 Tax=Streptomyces fradiae TaxID=1906 RepID=UPI0034074D71
MKKTIRDNYRIEITPDTWALGRKGQQDHNAMQRLLADIERAVQRHVNGIEQVVSLWDTHEECSHCGCVWEVLTADDVARGGLLPDEHSVEGEPVCCEAAVNEFRAERGIPPLADPGVSA